MRKILVSISSSKAQMQSAVSEAISIYQSEAVEIHLLNVQTIVPAFAARYFTHLNLRMIQEEFGQEELAPAQALLDSAGIPYKVYVKIGRSAETIVETARQIGCDRIVMGRPEHIDFVEKLFGTVASQVRHMVGGLGNCVVVGA